MAKKKNKPNPQLDGLSDRHVAAIIRRKMMSKDHGDESKYNRKDKSWKKDINTNKSDDEQFDSIKKFRLKRNKSKSTRIKINLYYE